MLADLPEPEAEPDAVSERVGDILGRGEFRRGENVVQAVGRRIGDFLDEIFGAFSGGSGGGVGSGVAWGVLVLALAAMVLVIVRWQRAARPSVGAPSVDVVAEAGEDDMAAADWARLADELEAAGRWREVVRARYRALLAELYERQLLDDVAGRTAGEYRSELAGRAPGASPAFDEVTARFETAWYGPTGATAGDAARVRDAAAGIMAELPS